MKQEPLDYQVWSDGDDDEEENATNYLMAVNVEKEVLKEITGVKGTVKKNYCFMVDTSKPSGVTMVEQVRIMISDLHYDFAACDPYLNKLEITMKDVLSAFIQTRDEMEACQQELFLLRERFEQKKLKYEKMERDYLLEKDSRIICENENRVYVNQRNVAREDNQRLLLVEKLYGSKHTFDNIDIIGNTYNWGWSRGEGLGKSNLPHSSPPAKILKNNDPFEPKVIPQTSSDESSSAAADSDSSASNDNIIITEDETPETSGSFYDKTNENIVGQIFNEENKLVKPVNLVNNTIKTTFVSSAHTNFKKITISCPPISSIPADTYNMSSISKSSPSQSSFSNNSSDDSHKSVLDSQRIHRSRTVRKSWKKKQHHKNWLLPNCSNISPSELKAVETSENLAIALTKLSEATLKINSSAAVMPTITPPIVPILHTSGTDSTDIHFDISTYDSDSSSKIEVVYAEKRRSRRMTKVPVPHPSTPTPIISEPRTTHAKSYSASKARLKCWIDEATMSFGYSPTKRKKRPTPPNNPKRNSYVSKSMESKTVWVPKLTALGAEQQDKEWMIFNRGPSITQCISSNSSPGPVSKS
ncbi:hypothetical protein LXL04_017051 [Taraxacum kok-saghyz]